MPIYTLLSVMFLLCVSSTFSRVFGQDETIQLCENCQTPENFRVAEVNDSSAILTWNLVQGYRCYYIQYRLEQDFTWRSAIACNNYLKLENITPCALYEARIATIIDTLDGGEEDRTQSSLIVISPISETIQFNTRLPRIKSPIVTTTYHRGQKTASLSVLNICPGDTATLQALTDAGKCDVTSIQWYKLERLPNAEWGNKQLILPCAEPNKTCADNDLLKHVKGENEGKNIIYEAEVMYQCPCGESVNVSQLSGGINIRCCTACP